jgi:hypothetical protein
MKPDKINVKQICHFVRTSNIPPSFKDSSSSFPKLSRISFSLKPQEKPTSPQTRNSTYFLLMKISLKSFLELHAQNSTISFCSFLSLSLVQRGMLAVSEKTEIAFQNYSNIQQMNDLIIAFDAPLELKKQCFPIALNNPRNKKICHDTLLLCACACDVMKITSSLFLLCSSD